VILSGLYPFLWKASSSSRLLLLEQYSLDWKSVFQYCCNNRRTKWPLWSPSNDCNNSC
jgi:hypothetical protein